MSFCVLFASHDRRFEDAAVEFDSRGRVIVTRDRIGHESGVTGGVDDSDGRDQQTVGLNHGFVAVENIVQRAQKDGQVRQTCVSTEKGGRVVESGAGKVVCVSVLSHLTGQLFCQVTSLSHAQRIHNQVKEKAGIRCT